MKKIIIAIDGFSSCGKSTMAKALAQALQYIHINTGSMYRATTLYFHQHQIDLKDTIQIEKALLNIVIHFEKDENGTNRTFLNGQDVEEEIRKMYISEQVSPVATIAIVREAMVAQQQKMSESKGVVLEGRDIGTVVFPNAELKIFMTADPNVRAERRLAELKAKDQSVDFEEVKANLLKRDHIDSTRKASPLKQAEDALVLDNTNITQAEQLEIAIQWAKERMNKVVLVKA